jgi:hypothetical protein
MFRRNILILSLGYENAETRDIIHSSEILHSHLNIEGVESSTNEATHRKFNYKIEVQRNYDSHCGVETRC